MYIRRDACNCQFCSINLLVFRQLSSLHPSAEPINDVYIRDHWCFDHAQNGSTFDHLIFVALNSVKKKLLLVNKIVHLVHGQHKLQL